MNGAVRVWRSAVRLALVALLALTGLQPAAAALPENPQGVLEAIGEELGAASELTEDQRRQLEQQLTTVAERLAQLGTERELRRELQATLDDGDERIADYQQRVLDIEDAPQTLRRRLGPNPKLDDIEAEIGIVESQREGWTSDRDAALKAMASFGSASALARDQLAETSEQLNDLPETDVPVDGPLEARLDAFVVAATRAALLEKAQRLQLEVRVGPTLNNNRSARIAWLDAVIADADKLLGELRSNAAEQRQSAAALRSAETRRLLESLLVVRPELQRLADENQSLIGAQADLGLRIEAARRSLATAREARERIEQDASLTRRRLEVAGLEAELGEVMLSRLASLPATTTIVDRSVERNARIADVSLSAIDTEQALRERADRASYLLGVLGPRDNWTVQERRVASQLYEQQRELLRENLEAENTLLRLLVDGNQASDELLIAVKTYSDFLTGNLLWTRNYAFTSPQRLQLQLAQLGRGMAPARLSGQFSLLYRDPLTLFLAFILGVTLVNRQRVRKRLRDMLGKPISPSSESAGMLLSALLLTGIRALPMPLTIMLLGRCAEVLGGGNSSLNAVAAALYVAALTHFGLSILRTLSSRLGAGRRLLKWNSAKADTLNQDMGWIAPALALALGIATLGRQLTPTDSGGPIAAAASFAITLLLLVFSVRALHAGTFSGDRMALLALRFAAVAAAGIAFLHLSGQLFAAHVYLQALLSSIFTVFFVLTVASVMQRMLQVYRFRLQQRAREEQRDREQGDDETTDPESEERANREETLASLSEAHSQLLNLLRLLAMGTLLWLIWSPALPALSVFDSVTLWSTTDSTLPEGELRPVTLSVLLLALLTLLITALVTRHLPPLVNILILEWGKVSAGGRYATGMLMQYLIIGVGLSIALGLLGFEWGKVQWLVAALGVGIGFGLQEIVANFISGLIVLFERPIRVGDIINAGGQDGVVSRINPRATVVETFEGKEVMIPNKELITNVVTNWSLTSPRLRVVIPVGVAYGSDVAAAMRLMVDIAGADPEILDEPKPIVTFEDFGDNALLLWLRCYATEQYAVVASGLRVSIYEAFADAGISIAFPQRDVHLDASDPIPVRMVEATATDS